MSVLAHDRGKSSEAQKSYNLLIHSISKRSSWVQANARYWRLYHTDQWSTEERSYLEEHHRFPIELNITAPIIDGFVSMIAANSPIYRPVPATDNSVRIATIAQFVMEYIGYISHFPQEYVQAAYDYTMCGIGWLQADVDTLLDYGAGEVINRSLRWIDVHWDWRSRRPGLRDRAWTMIFKMRPVNELKAAFPDKAGSIDALREQQWPELDDYANSITSVGSGETAGTQEQSPRVPMTLVGDLSRDEDLDFMDDYRSLPTLERYEMVYIKMKTVFDPAKGYDEYYTQEEWENPEILIPDDVRHDAYDVTIPRVRRVTTVGDSLELEDVILRCSEIPVVPIVKMSTGSAFPQGIVARMEGIQIEQNKRRLAMIENAMATAAGRLLAPMNSIDRDEWDKWSRVPGALIEYKTNFDMTKDTFIQLNAQPLPNQLFYLDQQQVGMMEYVSGIDSFFLGSTRNMPSTYRQSLMIENYGSRKVKAIDLTSIESSLESLGQVTLELAQWWYDSTKKLAILNDKGVLREVIINRADVDPQTGEIRGIFDSIRDSKFQVRMIAGSTMPKNRYAVLELYLSLFDRGIIPEDEVLKHTDVTDVDQILEKISRLNQAMSVIENMQGELDRSGQIINALENQLRQARIKSDSGSAVMMVELAALQRQMKERLSGALIDLSARNFKANLEREERYLSRIAEMQVENLVDLTAERLKMGRQMAQGGTAPS